jgi:Uma2 family endonuclease
MGETDVHRTVMFETIETLKDWYAGQEVYVTGNLLTFYRPGDKRRHVSPDAMVVKGVPPGLRLNYLIWEEGRGPQVVIEITSASTRREDLKKKFEIYRTEMRVNEYFLFDPRDEYLIPRLQGFRLIGDQYVSIEPVARRLASEELSLHLEGDGERLRLYDPASRRWLPTLHERSKEAERLAAEAKKKAEEVQQVAEQQQRQAAEENARLRHELEALRRSVGERGS